MFAWAPIPPRYAHLGSSSSPSCCWTRAKVAVAPGIGFGEHGDGHVRIALVENTHRLRQAIRNIRGFLQTGIERAAERGRCPKAASRHDPPAVPSALAGLGTVGAGVLKLLRDNADIVAARAGRPIAVTAVSRATARDRGVVWPGCAGTTTRWRWPPIPASMSWSS